MINTNDHDESRQPRTSTAFALFIHHENRMINSTASISCGQAAISRSRAHLLRICLAQSHATSPSGKSHLHRLQSDGVYGDNIYRIRVTSRSNYNPTMSHTHVYHIIITIFFQQSPNSSSPPTNTKLLKCFSLINLIY